MGIFDKLFGINREIPDSVFSFGDLSATQPARRGDVRTKKVFIDGNSAWKLKQRFIAFDVETTGFSPKTDRIIELGAVLFENRRPAARFSTLVNPGRLIPAPVSAVNHITNGMLRRAPGEAEAFAELTAFLWQVMNGQTFLCAHNAGFDCGFLSETLSRLGYDADIRYIDTLVLSRVYLKGLPNYRQSTVARHFSIDTGSEHRAGDDAEVCGHIMCRLIDLLQ